MENPRIRIESDGKTTELYIDGEKIEKVFEIDFHAEIQHIECEYEKYAENKYGCAFVEDGEIVKETHRISFDKE